MPDDAPLTPLTPAQEDFIRALVRVVLYLPRAVDADLGKELGMTSSEFFALVYLSESPHERLRMGELSAFTALSASATTRVVARLEGWGLVRRERADDDGRSHEAVLTDAGRRRLEAIRPKQLSSMHRRVFDKLGDLDLEPATAALTSICPLD